MFNIFANCNQTLGPQLRTLLMIMTASSSSGHWPLVSAALFLLGGADMLLVTGSRSLRFTDLLLSHLHRAG